MPTQSQIRDEVTARIVQALEADLLPGDGLGGRPWAAASRAAHQCRLQAPYQGVNPLLLELHAMRLGLTSRWWVHFSRLEKPRL